MVVITVFLEAMTKFVQFFRCSVDLSVLTRDFSHDIWRELEDGAGRLHLLISVSGLTSDFESLETTDELTGQHHLISKDAIPDDKRQEFALRNSLKDLNEVGYLVVKVFCAKGKATRKRA